MMNSTPVQTIPTIEQPTTLPSTQLNFPVDPTNPVVWILVISILISSIDEPINAIAKLLEAITAFKKTKTQQKSEESETKD